MTTESQGPDLQGILNCHLNKESGNHMMEVEVLWDTGE